MNRRFILKGGLVLAATSHTAVATADIGRKIEDPLLDAIHAYQAGLEDFNRNAPEDDEGSIAYAQVSYIPHLVRLDEWNEPARTREGAIEALRISLTNKGGVYGCEAADRMVQAAIGYLEGMA